MSNRFTTLLASAVVAGLTTSFASAGVLFNDATGENFDGNAHMDIKSVTVSNTATDITFAVQVNGVIGAGTDWGKYMVGIDTSAGGDPGTPVGNPWGRNIKMSANGGMDAWIGTWADSGGGAQPFTWGGASWTQNGQVAPTIAGDTTTFTVSLASLGLSVGQTFNFDVYSGGGGGGDSANDALGKATQTINDWQVPYDSAANTLSYTVTVPEPTSLALAGLGVMGLAARRRRA